MRVDDNLPGKKGQKSRQGRRPSTRAEGAGRAAIESPFHRCRHRRSPAISLSPSTTRAASFPIFCRPLRFPVSCFFTLAFWLIPSIDPNYDNKSPPLHFTRTQSFTGAPLSLDKHRAINYTTGGLPMKKGKTTTTTTHEKILFRREGGKKRSTSTAERTSERESHPFTTVGSTEMDPISR